MEKIYPYYKIEEIEQAEWKRISQEVNIDIDTLQNDYKDAVYPDDMSSGTTKIDKGRNLEVDKSEIDQLNLNVPFKISIFVLQFSGTVTGFIKSLNDFNIEIPTTIKLVGVTVANPEIKLSSDGFSLTVTAGLAKVAFVEITVELKFLETSIALQVSGRVKYIFDSKDFNFEVFRIKL